VGELIAVGGLQGIRCVPCSLYTEAEARRLGVPLTTLDDAPEIDLTIDGADEIAPNLDVIKGGGGALLREKIVAQASRRMIVVADESKLSPALGTNFAVPVEVIPFGWRAQARFVESLGARVTLRQNQQGEQGEPELVKTDQGNFILDCAFGAMASPTEIGLRLAERAGIVEHGLFLGLVTDAIIAGAAGLQHITKV
jgi:ribose 5-phosphate isomerase A